MTGDEIHILGLEMPVRIGVPETERAAWQTVRADITVTLEGEFDKMQDELDSTLDYERAANEATALAASRPRQLLETLAADLVGHFLRDDRVRAVEVLLRKRILPHTDAVAVRLRREKR
ncbi:dihydroneopterin aldolase [Roseimicrobium gellanilyticum]|uniref:dihydroneopterin aldolase n=1 Tax=Roseimicrobium gellanilyticum TaxID=748857 RepID=A0A366HP04_9BACT|nr:dihydroneopterin aldolase [Roseimicrobium gellanilyticum]RBP44516.1 dihydroneopterin aldolase [Roseimicrobium gellanilyticum]